jgi:hypothetical protein
MANGVIRGDYIERRKPVYKFKKEDDFVDNGRRLWYATCFDFEECGRNIAKHASADLMGRPCCADYFHPSLQRSEGTHLRTTSMPLKEPKLLARAAWGGMLRGKSVERGRYGRPVIPELTQRLYIANKDMIPSKREPLRPLQIQARRAHSYLQPPPHLALLGSRMLSQPTHLALEPSRHLFTQELGEKQVDPVIGKIISHVACVGSRYLGPPGTSKMNLTPTPVRVAETTHPFSLRSNVLGAITTSPIG